MGGSLPQPKWGSYGTTDSGPVPMMRREIDRLQKRVEELESVWMEYLVEMSGLFAPIKVCGLCGNSGRVHLHVTLPARTSREANVDAEIHDLYCICPNGRVLKESKGD